MAEPWELEVKRTCEVCGGDGKFKKPPSTGPGQQHYSVFNDPPHCQRCQGKGVERRSLTFAKLKEALEKGDL